MNVSFYVPEFGVCVAKIWATGRYGFSQPKKVDIILPTQQTFVYLHDSRYDERNLSLSKKELIRLAIAQFLRAVPRVSTPTNIDIALPPFKGTLTPIRRPGSSRASPVRPGKTIRYVRSELDS